MLRENFNKHLKCDTWGKDVDRYNFKNHQHGETEVMRSNEIMRSNEVIHGGWNLGDTCSYRKG